MDQSTITAAVRRAMREPQPVTVTDTDIETVTLRGVGIVGMMMKQYAPLTLVNRKSLQSNTNVFAFPSGCEKVLRLQDMNDNAFTPTSVTGNGVTVQITYASHGLQDDDLVYCHDFEGNTEPNDTTWKVDNATTNTFELYGSTGDGAWTNATGKVFKETADFETLELVLEEDLTFEGSNKWALRDEKIVVDNIDFEDDLILRYRGDVSAITDIPAKWHQGLVSYCVMELLVLPDQSDPKYQELARSLSWQKNLWDRVVSDIKLGSGQSLRVAHTDGQKYYI